MGGGGGRPTPPTPGNVALPSMPSLPLSPSKLRVFTSGVESTCGLGGGETAPVSPPRARAGVGAVVKSAAAPSLGGVRLPLISCVTGVRPRCLALAVIGIS